MFRTLVVGSLYVTLLPEFAQAEVVSRAEMLANSCAACHGADGRGSKTIPELKGIEVDDFVKTMNGFQTSEESSTIMDRHAKEYTDEDIRLLAEYFAGLD